MIINSAPTFEAEIGNAGAVSEFKIRASAKAFGILSSGLYANKIRAIIRELSCNAVDSHVAAGKKGTPFDVHLPNSLEPHFSIRDYGTGLSHEQVTQIYTTYFESSKTDSNDYVGALGLGSKSPFSYTDNFTITAIKNGIKGVYTAFINGQGVPSIAQMASEETKEPAGVEIQFSVNDRWDFDKFRNEAQSVYSTFELQPVVSGCDSFNPKVITYIDRDIIPGVHTVKGHSYNSVAVMGNIAYPIQIPQGNNLNRLRRLLDCNLEIHFNIGEVDFQASREGLSYIPETIQAIQLKLEQLNAVLTSKLATDMDAIKNNWDRAHAINTKSNEVLWQAAVAEYVKANVDKNPLIDASRTSYYIHIVNPGIMTKELEKLNISVEGFTQHSGHRTVQKLRPEHISSRDTKGEYITETRMEFAVSDATRFVINDIKKGGMARATYHYKTLNASTTYAYVLTPIDATKPMKLKAFYKKLHNPPAKLSINVSEMPEKPRKEAVERAKNVSILQLGHSSSWYGGGKWRWNTAGKSSDYDDSTTYYYFAVKGLAFDSGYGVDVSIDTLANNLNTVRMLDIKTVYGVRRSDIELIKSKSNWINIEDVLSKKFNALTEADILKYIASEVDIDAISTYNSKLVAKIDVNSAFVKLANKFKGVSKEDSYKVTAFKQLVRWYATGGTFESIAGDVFKEVKEVATRYPMLKYISDYQVSGDTVVEIANYINLVDSK